MDLKTYLELKKPVKCKICGTSFVRKQFKNVYCSDKCRQINNLRLKKEARKRANLMKLKKLTKYSIHAGMIDKNRLAEEKILKQNLKKSPVLENLKGVYLKELRMVVYFKKEITKPEIMEKVEAIKNRKYHY